jgi:hypothetical protein
MALSLSLIGRNAAGSAIVGMIDTGTKNANGYLEIRSGNKPETPQIAATGELLATLSFSNPAFGPMSEGSTTSNAVAPDISVDATGVAGWFRIYNRDNNAVIDGTVTAQGGGGDLEFDNINFIAGGTVQITTFVLTVPNSL